MNEIDTLLQSALTTIEKILEVEKFSTYVEVKSAIETCIILIKANEFEKVESKLIYCARMIMEAPPRNSELGLTLLNKIDLIITKISLN